MIKAFRFCIALLIPLVVFSGCTTTFAGTVLVLTFRDILLYVFMAFIIAVLIALKSEHEKRAFWIWFIASLLLTPLAGIIYFLVLFSRKV